MIKRKILKAAGWWLEDGKDVIYRGTKIKTADFSLKTMQDNGAMSTNYRKKPKLYQPKLLYPAIV